ncbi:MAG: DUF1349 domain-containing protein [Candidatus Hydrogenedentes bacterium]|nr:DUF1349 domain-containing protein [Candidatus Hydrogenedentota bacterium]
MRVLPTGRLGWTIAAAIATALPAVVVYANDNTIFRDDFRGKLADGWRWVRENPAAWRVTDSGLEIRVEPGNLWGGKNDAKNVLVRDLPKIENGALSVEVTVENKPTNQYEQVNLVWYYDDSNMVKIGLELVDGEVCMVMGREQDDSTRTIAKPPIGNAISKLRLRLTARGAMLKGEYCVSDADDWKTAGECELPVKGDAKVSIQAYQGPSDAEHWAKISEFRLLTRE